MAHETLIRTPNQTIRLTKRNALKRDMWIFSENLIEQRAYQKYSVPWNMVNANKITSICTDLPSLSMIHARERDHMRRVTCTNRTVS